ncbi:MAG: acetyl-CoA carboxylase biotin carboxyl carrier protein [Planctomycetia bacterium]|nr:acetyl-CoA carboxylase biotin carboxyl carrier protein [Planctomycetia bacterium]
MSDAGPGDVFDLKKLRQLVVLMNDHELSEIDLRQGAMRIRLRRQFELPGAPVEVRHAGLRGGATTGGETRGAASAPPPPPSDQHLVVIKSPMVGTFYAAPSPDAPPFVKVGDRIGRETTVCIIEAMKVFNEIPAETAGQIAAVLVESGAPVEFGQALFKVDPRQ